MIKNDQLRKIPTGSETRKEREKEIHTAKAKVGHPEKIQETTER